MFCLNLLAPNFNFYINYKITYFYQTADGFREVLYEIKACSHPTIMNDMCAECGADLRKDETPKSSASVPMIHAIPDLKVSEEVSFFWF